MSQSVSHPRWRAVSSEAHLLGVALLVSCLAPPANSAPAASVREQWEFTSTMQMRGMTMPGAPAKICMDANRVLPPTDKSCTLVELKRDADRGSFRLECTGPQAMQGEGVWTRRGDTMDSTLQLRTARGEMTLKQQGRRLGACPAGAAS